MPSFDLFRHELEGETIPTHGLLNDNVKVHRLKGDNVQIVGELCSAAPSMIDDRMRSADPLLCGMIESSAELAGAALAEWRSHDLAVDPDDTREETMQALSVKLEDRLAPAVAMMRKTADLARSGGAYYVFRRALVEPADQVLVANRTAHPELVRSFVAFDRAGLKTELRHGPDLGPLRQLIRRRWHHHLDDLYVVSVYAKSLVSEISVSALRRKDAAYNAIQSLITTDGSEIVEAIDAIEVDGGARIGRDDPELRQLLIGFEEPASRPVFSP